MRAVHPASPAYRGTIPEAVLAYGLTADELAEWRAAGYLPPLAGADDGPAGAGGGDGSGGDEGTGAGDGDGDGDEGAAAGGDGDGDEGDEGTGGDAELEAARRAAAKANKELRELKGKQAETDRKAAEEAGKWKELYEDTKAELDALKTSAETEAKGKLIEAAATAAGFVNPATAIKLLDDVDAIEDKLDAERAIKKLAKAEPYLVKPKAARTRTDAGDGDSAGDSDAGGSGDGKGSEPFGPDRLRRAFAATGKK